MEKLEIGGNALFRKWGKYFTKIGVKYTKKGEKLIVTNPTCKLLNPYLLVINFTVNNTDKYTLSLQGNYKEKYKNSNMGGVSYDNKTNRRCNKYIKQFRTR